MTEPCVHERTSRAEVYEYCEDCGAVRNIPSASNQRWGTGWHTCALCRLPTVRKEEDQ